ncbi:MAG: hypothetical protein KDN22_33265, partial [Verrucomicrobiae bacterium]|nr:hypothetical protein [Verrucomicrobiae bacterium]
NQPQPNQPQLNQPQPSRTQQNQPTSSDAGGGDGGQGASQKPVATAESEVTTPLGELGIGAGDREDWNALPSKLQEELIQKQGTAPPDRYRRAIDAYFERIGGGRRSLKKEARE